MSGRRKISTTISQESDSYLRGLVAAGKARNLSGALDLALARLRRAERRERLERATAAYFESLPAEAENEESALQDVLDQSADDLDFDRS
jgi:hypothetical protein